MVKVCPVEVGAPAPCVGGLLDEVDEEIHTPVNEGLLEDHALFTHVYP